MSSILNIKSLKAELNSYLAKLGRYSLVAFIVFVALLYGFLLLRANGLDKVQPSDEAVNKQVKSSQVLHIDQSVVQQLQTLQDNSVSVQALFNQARSNPFQ